MSRTIAGVWIGMLITSSISGIRQDMMGLGKYQAYVAAAWMPERYSTPLELFSFGCAVVWLVLQLREEARNGN